MRMYVTLHIVFTFQQEVQIICNPLVCKFWVKWLDPLHMAKDLACIQVLEIRYATDLI